MTPFHMSSALVRGLPQVVIFNAPWEEVWPTLGLRPEDVALVWADPPYGQGERTDRARRGRGINPALPKQGKRLAAARDWEPVHGDDAPFNPAPLLAVGFPRLVLWGANRYASQLPNSSSWWWWDKRDGTTPDDNGDGELAWTNLGGPPRQFSHLWRGVCQASEKSPGERRLHPTQKPVALSTWGFQQARLAPGSLVLSPYMGSGPELQSALALGLRIIACEVAAAYCRAAVDKRIRQGALQLYAAEG